MVEYALKNEAFAAKLAITYGELFDGISPVKQRVALRIVDRELELKNVSTHQDIHWNLDEMCEVEDLRTDQGMTFAADQGSPARLMVQEVDALRTLAETGARFPAQRGSRAGFARVLLGVGVFVATVLVAFTLGGGLVAAFAEVFAAFSEGDVKLPDLLADGK